MSRYRYTDPRQQAARHDALSRRNFLRGLGAPPWPCPCFLRCCRALPGRPSPSRAGPAPHGVFHDPQWRRPDELVAHRRRPRFFARQNNGTARAVPPAHPNHRRPRPRKRHARPRWRRRPRPRRRDLSHRHAGPQNGRRRYPLRHLRRSGGRPGGRPPDSLPVDRAHLRRNSQLRQLRQRLCLRLSVQPILVVRDDAADARTQPAAGLRAPLRHRRARRANGRSRPRSRHSEIGARLRAR